LVRQFCQFSQFSLVCTFHTWLAWYARLALFASFTHGQLGLLVLLGLHGVLIIVGYAMFTMESCSTQCHGHYSMYLALEQWQTCYGQLYFCSKHGQSVWLVVLFDMVQSA
jgi:hypothetical protein